MTGTRPLLLDYLCYIVAKSSESNLLVLNSGIVSLQAGLSRCLLFPPLGIARLMSDSRRDGPHIPWVLPPGISQAQLGGVFKLEWIHK